MAFTFKKQLSGVSIGTSLFDEAGSQKVASLMEKAKSRNLKVVFPVDYITADKFDKDAQTGYATDEQGIPDGWMGLDAGPKSRELYRETVLQAKTILWNGPPGVFEFEKFAEGSKALLAATIEAAGKGATVIVGGGDTATVVAQFGGEEELTKTGHVSTGGGASLELLEGKVSASQFVSRSFANVPNRPSLVSLRSARNELSMNGCSTYPSLDRRILICLSL